MRTPKIAYKIQTQLVDIYSSSKMGTRRRLSGMIGSRKSSWRTWDKHRNMVENVRDAVNHITRTMLKEHYGGIVIIRQIVSGHPLRRYTKIYQAKWGTDNKPFARFDGIAGGYWKRQLGN